MQKEASKVSSTLRIFTTHSPPPPEKQEQNPCVEGLLIRVAIERQGKLQVVKPEWCGDTHFNPDTQEGEAGGSLRVQGQPEVHAEFQATQNYILRP